MNEFNDDQLPASESLKHLAEAYGVSTEYWDYHGNLASPSSATLKAVLTALGVRARTDEEIETSLKEVEDAPHRRHAGRRRVHGSRLRARRRQSPGARRARGR